MDKKGSNILISIDSNESNLQFHEVSHNISVDLDTPSTDRKHLIPGQSQDQNIFDSNEGRSKSSSPWSIEYYQIFFDVDTDTVIKRIKGSIYPEYGGNFLQSCINSKPDLYGPFWICVTLIFTIAISGNIANYRQSVALHKHYWKYDFHAVSTSATAIFSYAWLIPVLVWAFLKSQSDPEIQSVSLSLLELLCVYGYSLSIYIPIAVLWVIQVGFLQVTLAFAGAILSGYILVNSLAPAFRRPNIVPLVVICGLHLLLALGLMFYFFHVPELPPAAADIVVTSIAPSHQPIVVPSIAANISKTQ